MPLREGESPEIAFERVREVLDGRRLRIDASARKMIQIVVSADSDVTISQRGLFVQYPGRRNAFTYFPSLAAPLLSALLRHAPHGPPCRFRIEPAALARIAMAGNETARWLWIEAGADAVTIRCRVATELGEPPPEALPLEPWAPVPQVFTRCAPPRPCPHCERAFERFRWIDDVFVCLGCGRSFHVDAAERLRTPREDR